MIDQLLNAIRAANLPAPVYRTARELLDRAGSDGYVRLSYEEALAIVQTDKPETLRGHLAQLQRAGLLTYRRNAAVHVMWHIQNARVDIHGARLDIQNARMEDDPAGVPVGESNNLYTRPNNLYIQPRVSRGTPTLPVGKVTTGTTGKVGKDQPTYLPAVEAAQGEPQPPEDQPLTDQERSVDLLTDPAVGCTVDFAEKLAAKHPFAQIRLQVFHALRQMAEPGSRVTSIGIIEHRLKVKAPAAITDADCAGELWARHRTRAEQEADAAAEAEAERIAAQWEAEHQAVPPAPPRPAPEPGTPAAFWRQLQSDFAMHQPAGAVDSVIQDSWVIDYADGVFTVGIADAFRLDWVEKKLRNQIKRRLAVIMQRATVDVKFQVGEQQP